MALPGGMSAEAWSSLLAATRRRQQAEREALVEREHRAWELARQAADLLRRDFHAERVFVFGSLIRPGSFTEWSDVDVAADGIDPRDTLLAMESVGALSAEIPVNLADLNACRASLRATIEREGQPL